MEWTLVRSTDRVPVAAAFASALEEACSSAVTDLYPAADPAWGSRTGPWGRLCPGLS